MLLLIAALLPGLYWDQGIETAPALKQAGIERVYAPAARVDDWRKAGFQAQAFDPAKQVKATAPGVEYKISEASATRVPWIDANGWRFLRRVSGPPNQPRLYRTLYYEVPAGTAALAAAEPYSYGAGAVVCPQPEDLDLLGRMLAFLRQIDRPPMPVMANIAVIDDGSDETGEVLNLLARRNLLFTVVKAPDPRYDLNVRIGSKEYPREEAADPYAFAVKIRQQLTDEKRLVRIYGSDVVLVHLTGDGRHARLHLLNYARRPVNGLRVRVMGNWVSGKLSDFDVADAALLDYTVREGGAEFTIPKIVTYAVVDLTAR